MCTPAGVGLVNKNANETLYKFEMINRKWFIVPFEFQKLRHLLRPYLSEVFPREVLLDFHILGLDEHRFIGNGARVVG